MKKSIILLLFCLVLASCSDETQQVPTNAEEVTPLQTGQTVPNGTLKNQHGDEIDLHDLTSEAISLFVFYRGGWCPYCDSQLNRIASIEDRITARGVQIIAISPDRPEFIREYLSENELGYTLLSDSDMSVSKDFGIAFRADSETVTSLKEAGMDIEKQSGYDHHILPVPSVFLTGRDGRIYFQFSNPDYTERISEEALINAVNELLEIMN